MKNHLVFIVFSFNIFYSSIAFSQYIKSNEVRIKINKEERSAVSIISEAEIKPFQKAWADNMKKNYNAKSSSNNKSVISNAVIVPTLSTNPINVYAFFNENKEGCEIAVAAEMEAEKFISSKDYPDEYKRLKSITESFVINFLKTKYEDLIKEQQKAVNKSVKQEIKMQKNINSLEKSISKDSENIQKLQKRIEQSKIEIEKNEALLPEIKKETDAKRAGLKELESRKEKLF